MKLKALKILSIFIIILFSTGCATILGGKSNRLVFSDKNNTPAEVFVDGELVGKAPGKIKLPKEKIQHGSILVIKSEGYSEKEYMILRKQNTLYTIADFILLVPLVVDYTTGNIYRPVPRTFKYELIKE